jgi:hypothetical protein
LRNSGIFLLYADAPGSSQPLSQIRGSQKLTQLVYPFILGSREQAVHSMLDYICVYAHRRTYYRNAKSHELKRL